MALERVYTIPLRKDFLKAPKYKRTKRAISAIKQFMARHMKCDNVKIGRYLNLEMWKHGRKNPPSKIQVKAVKDKKKVKDKEMDFVKVELVNAPEEKIEEKKKGLKEKLKEKISGKEEPKKEEKPEGFKEELEKEKKEVLLHEKLEKEIKEKGILKAKPAKEIKQKKIIGRTSKK